jgi:FAD-linked sulfhydryl oxidase
MPITELYLPILSRFLCAVEMITGLPAQPLDAPPEQRQRIEQDDEKKSLPKGVVLGPDGKPCVQSCARMYRNNR